ncbi:MAG: FAD-binding oxidoreductase [Clostridiales Family XIII bacterium]|jgi:sarcosine oxidase subunit beta|nr:FAD-binding oxidoreductase [Clostridiales Family XIII bacterium]
MPYHNHTEKKSADVIVIGGGVIGCAAAYRLAKEGVSVLVLEKNEICSGASGRNAGGVRQSARDVRELPLAMYGVKHIWPALSEELGVDVEYTRAGNLRLGRTAAHLEKLSELAENSSKVGLDVRMVTGGEAREICPYMSADVLGASWCPTDGYANPLTTTIGFYKKALSYGAVFITGITAIGLGKVKGRVRNVYTDDGVYEADRVLVCAGYASRAIVNTVGIDVPVEREDEEVFVTEQLPPMFDQVLGTAEADFYGHQTKHGSFLLGGVSGLQHFTSNHDGHPTEAYTAPSLVRGIIRFFPSFAGVKIIRNWSGQFDSCVDGVPVIDNAAEAPGLTLAFAFTGHGFGISPSVSIALKELIMDGNSKTIDVSGLKYDRFAAKQ